MPGLVVVGAQWGDEGKGKLVDYLTSEADGVVRFQGGNNAGHTLVVDGKKTSLHLVPSGILRERTRCFIAAGVVVNPEVLWHELESLRAAGTTVEPERLLLDRDAHLILPYHVELDLAREESRGKDKIGTTGRGIGPCYQDRAERCGVRLADLFELNSLEKRMDSQVQRTNLYLKHVLQSEREVSLSAVMEVLKRAAENFLPFIGNVSLEVERLLDAQKKIVFEGAQGTLLDQTHGTVPYVTSSSTLAGSATAGVGMGASKIDHVLGVAKAYCTRVGSGPFPTEISGSLGDELREKGNEYGTTTGRPRRVGWFDAFAAKRAVRLNGLDSLALTKLDVLSGFEKIKVCVKYSRNGQELDDVPALSEHTEQCECHYIEFDGWQENLGEVTKWHHLPANTRFYLTTLAEIIGCPVSIVSFGPERESTLFSSAASFVQNFAEKKL